MKSSDLYPSQLKDNEDCSFLGANVNGQGFVLTPEQRNALITSDPKNGERIFPYLGGKEVNTSPTQDYHRYVISFGAMSLEEASRWPDLLAIVREHVKPERDRQNQAGLRKYWWLFSSRRPGLFTSIAPLPRCLVTSQVTKHLCFSFQPPGRIYSHKLYVFPLETHTAFAVLQSRVHEVWVRLLSSTLGTGLNYSATDCFRTFPFPKPSPKAIIPELEIIGQEYYSFRSKYLVEHNVGLTEFYNNPPPQHEALKKELDLRVAQAYGWGEVPSEDEIIDRLLILNKERSK